MERLKNIVVIGASAGGLDAIRTVITGLKSRANAAIFVVLHVSRKSDGQRIVNLFQKSTTLNCRVSTDGTVIKKGHLYLAPPDHHLMLRNNKMVVSQGPHENKYRPSIDVLFRSAAVACGHKVIGVILTGLLEDGTSGMSAVKRCGGTCIVQDPEEAEHADMPLSVLNRVKPDYIAPLETIPALLNRLFERALPPKVQVPRELKIEADITANRMSDIDQLRELGEQSDFTCPDCGGSLWAVKNDPAHRYRCFTGHVFSAKTLYDLQAENIEESVYVSIRMLEERLNLLGLMAVHAENAGQAEVAKSNRIRGEEMERHISRLKSLLTKLVPTLQGCP